MILVIGGTGLLGGHLLFELMKGGRLVRCMYRCEEKKEKVRQLFDYYANGEPHRYEEIEWTKGDILDLVSLEDAFKNVETVYHCAALVSFKKADFRKMLKINRLGTANVVNMALKHGVKKLGYVSSTATIGANDCELSTENHRWELSAKNSGYAISKYNAEREVWRATQEGLDSVIINPSIIIGAGNLTESSLAIFGAIKRGLKLYSPGANAFVDARDVADSFIKLMEGGVANERYLCVAENRPFRDLLTLIANQLQVKPPSICVPKWLAMMIAGISEFFSRLVGVKSSLSIESVRSAYAISRYSNEKIKQQVNIKWYSLEESVENVIKYQQWLSKNKL